MARKAKKKQAELRTAARHRAFALEFIKDYNGTRAYRAVYGEKLSAQVAAVNASRLLKDAKVRGLVEAAEKDALDELRLNARRILREQARVAFADPAALFDEHTGALKALKDIDPDARAAIASVEVEELFEGSGKERERIGNLVKVKLWNKNEAGANLMKHKGLFKADNDQRSDVLAQFMEAVSGHSRGLPGRYKQRSD